MIRYIVSVSLDSLHRIMHASNERTSRWIVLSDGVVGRTARMVGGLRVEVGGMVVGLNLSGRKRALLANYPHPTQHPPNVQLNEFHHPSIRING